MDNGDVAGEVLAVHDGVLKWNFGQAEVQLGYDWIPVFYVALYYKLSSGAEISSLVESGSERKASAVLSMAASNSCAG